MEPHPVPQNILDTEFKLFGAFTLTQFSKIVIGCLGGVAIFFLLNINPLVKIPLILLSVGTGVLMAIIPNFGIWLNGFLKALFISPRYVWVKETSTPELLQQKKMKDPKNDLEISSALNKKKLNIEDLPLEKLFGTRGSVDRTSSLIDDDIPTAQNKNMARVYEEVFGNEIVDSSKMQPVQQNIESQQTISQKVAIANAQKAVKPDVKSQFIYNSLEEYQNAINRLQFELSKLQRDGSDKIAEEKILNEINDLYREYRLMQGERAYKMEPQVKAKIIEMESRTAGGRIVFGIVVDKKDKPLANAKVTLRNISNNIGLAVLTNPNGRFATPQALPKGDYEVFIDLPNKKFHTYKIAIAEQELPGYKFRER